MGASMSVENYINKQLFRPPKYDIASYYENVRPGSEDLTFISSTNGKRICTYRITSRLFKLQKDDKKECIIFSHGNASDVHDNRPFLKNISDTLFIDVIWYDYQGYGLSEGTSSEKTCYEDLDSVVQHAYDLGYETIYLMGQSLGTGIVIHHVSTHEWHAPIILLSPYKTIAKVVYDSSLVRPFDRFCSERKMKNVTCPVKIFHGLADDLIMPSHSERLFELTKNKQFQPTYIKGGSHCLHHHLDIKDLCDILAAPIKNTSKYQEKARSSEFTSCT